MADMNEVHLTGRLTADVDLKSTANGGQYVWFTLAVNGYKDKNGNQSTDFVKCSAFGKPAQFLGQFGKKGMRLMISRGALKVVAKENPQTGQKQEIAFVRVGSFEFLDSLKKGNQESFFENMGSEVEIDF